MFFKYEKDGIKEALTNGGSLNINDSLLIKIEAFSWKDLFFNITFKPCLLHLFSKFVLRDVHADEFLIKGYDGEKLVGVISATSKSSRFRFMDQNDVQFGNVFVLNSYRGNNIAGRMMLYGLQKINAESFWYLVSKENSSSIRAVEKSNFHLFGYGTKVRKGGSIFGVNSYELVRKVGG